MDRVSIIIPNWNGSALLAKLLADLKRQSYPIDRVIVVDNGSTDDSVRVARSAGASLIELSANTGFAHAVNQGIRNSNAEWIAILNNDTSFESDWLTRMMENLAGSDA